MDTAVIDNCSTVNRDAIRHAKHSTKHLPVSREQYENELLDWQTIWKQVIAMSVIYLDGSTQESNKDAGAAQYVQESIEKDTLRSQIKQNCLKFHARVVDFFNEDDVTLIISKRSFKPKQVYPQSDIFSHSNKIRIWSFEKATRFFALLSKPIVDSSTSGKRRALPLSEKLFERLKPNEHKRAKRFFGSGSAAENQQRKSADSSDNRTILIKKLQKNANTINTASSSSNYQKQVFQKLNIQKQQGKSTQFPTSKKTIPHKHMVGKPTYKPATSEQLSALLTKEKLHGPTDRDPNVVNHNFHYFKNYFVHIYDLKQRYRPIMTYEWPTKSLKDGEVPWGKFRVNADGRCPFVEQKNIMDEQNVEKRLETFAQTKAVRMQLRKLFPIEVDDDESDFDGESSVYGRGSRNDMHSKKSLYDLEDYNSYKSSHSGATGLAKAPNMESSRSGQRSSLGLKTSEIAKSESKKRTFTEMQASGLSQSNTSQVLVTTTNNKNIVPNHSQVQSKQVNSLKKRIVEKQVKDAGKEKKSTKEKAVQPKKQLCENCRIIFTDLEEHMKSSIHTAFAKDDRNFVEIDDFIKTIRGSVASGPAPAQAPAQGPGAVASQ